jgi:hypothetical protein
MVRIYNTCPFLYTQRDSLTLVLWCAADGQNDQTLADAGPEADLDTQFGLGLTFPTPGTFYSTGGSPPFTADALTPTNTNEPYDNVSCTFYHTEVLTLRFAVSQ